MSAFVNPDDQVVVSDDNGNGVTIRAKMSLAHNAQVIADMKRFGFTNAGQNLGLLAANIVAWDGPLFRDGLGNSVPCNRANVFRLDPTNAEWSALQTLILAKIDELNRRETLDSSAPN